MADPFVAEIRIFPFNFAPRGWAFCDGQLLPIPQNTALFSLLGTTYGGDGASTFALPDIQGRAVLQHGQGPGLSDHLLGESAGDPTVTLLESEIPSHSHGLRGSSEDNDASSPAGAHWGGLSRVYAAPTGLEAMDPNAITPTGADQPHNNMMPYLTFNFCIALQGVLPATRLSAQAYALRTALDSDRETLFRVYAGTRAPEMALVPDWSDAQKHAFITQQFEAQDRYYRENYAGASFAVIVAGEEPVGRLYVARWPEEIRLIDLALLPERRARGLGTCLLRDLQDESRSSDRPLRIHVERYNRALRLYKRLGFRMIEDRGVHLFLEWRDSSAASAGARG